MADFLQAVKWMQEGKKVWRKGTDKVFHKTALVCLIDQDGKDFHITNTLWFLAKDWEIYLEENKEPNFAMVGAMVDDILNAKSEDGE